MNNSQQTDLLSIPFNASIRVQSILYNTPEVAVERSLEYFENASQVAREAGVVGAVRVALGDCSPKPCLEPATLDSLRRRYSGLDQIDCTFFDCNLGHGGAQNRLMETEPGDALLVIANPDVLVAPRLFIELIGALSQPNAGIAEARQLPIDHPKEYDRITGETSWASGACLMVSANLFHQVGGFDAKTFFMHGDDVDFSWRVRLSGFRIIHVPDAPVFHDKRLTPEGGCITSEAERYYSAEARLLLPYKYSRPDLTDEYLEIFLKSDDEYLRKAAESFKLRSKTGRLPRPIDANHAVAEFINGGYSLNRYAPR